MRFPQDCDFNYMMPNEREESEVNQHN